MTDDDRNDETQAMSPDDEPTRVIPAGDDEATRVMRNDDAVTRRIEPGPRTEATPTRRMAKRTTSGGPATEVIPVARTGGGMGWIVALVVAVALVAGAVAGYAQHRPSDRNVVARALVGPGGGTITFDGSGVLTVPAGALPAPTAITVRKETIGKRVRLGGAGDPRAKEYAPGELVVYAFEPADLRFQQPVTIELPRRGTGSAIFVDARDGPRVIAGQVEGDVIRVTTTDLSFSSATAAGVSP